MTTAIVGGGVGGLVTALYLSHAGQRVEVFERSEKLGGRLAYVERDGYKIDEGPTIVLLPHMLLSILREAGVDLAQLQLMPCDPLYNIHFKDGTTYTKYRGTERQVAEVERFAPADAESFRAFMAEMRERFTIGYDKFLSRSFVRKRDFFTKDNLLALWRMKAYEDVYSFVSRYFKDERMRVAYSLQTLYIGGNPYATPGMYTLVPFSEHEHGVHYVKGGYAKLVEVMEAELVRRGVAIHKGTAVAEVETDGKRATALRLATGERRPFNRFVLNGDFPGAQQLLKQKQRSFVPSSGCVLLYFGLNRQYDAPIHQFFMGDDFRAQMKQVFEVKEVPTDPSIYTFYPSAVDDSLAPEGHSVLYVLVPVPSGSVIHEGNLPTFVETIKQQLQERAFPQLAEAIVWEEVRSPAEAKRDGLFEGGSFGIAPTLFQSGVFRPQLQPFVQDNVYAVGASVHPGGGIPIVMQGAKLLANVLLQTETVGGKANDGAARESVSLLRGSH